MSLRNQPHASSYLGDFPAWRGDCLRCGENVELRAAWLVCGEIFTLALCRECRELAPTDLDLPGGLLGQSGGAAEEVFTDRDRDCLRALPGATMSATSMGLNSRAVNKCVGWGLLLRTENRAYHDARQQRTGQFCYELTDRGRAALDGTLAAESVPRVQAPA